MSSFNRHLEFSDTEDIREAVAAYGWEVTYTRTGLGVLGVAAWETLVGDLLLYREHFEFPMLAYGVSPSDAFSVLTVQAGSLRVYGEPLSLNKVALLPPGAEIDAVSLSELELFHVQVSQDKLFATARLEDTDLAASDRALNVALGPDRIRHLAHLMDRGNAILDAGDENAWSEIEDDLLALLVAVFDRREVEMHRVDGSTSATDGYAIEARRYVDSALPGELEIGALADDLGITRRHLNRSFKQHYGLSLRDFIHYRRLHKARALLREHREGQSVTEIAYTCGFRHLGRFSTQYKQLFGESPSQTLRPTDL
jgi:AraC-like DNA-binding protein